MHGSAPSREFLRTSESFVSISLPSAHLFTGSTSYSDGHVDPKFIVAFSSTLVSQLSAEELKGRHMPMMDHEGFKYLCVLPDLADIEASIHQQGATLAGDLDRPEDEAEAADSAPADTSPADAGENLSQLLAKLEGSCLYRMDGWWTYELCIGRHLRQFHREPHAKEDTTSYTLGRFTDGTQTRPGPSESPLVGASVVQNFEEGSVCDLTGQERSTTVRFVCNHLSPGVGPSLLSEVKEEATCQYAATVSTPILCDHPKFGPRQVHVVEGVYNFGEY